MGTRTRRSLHISALLVRGGLSGQVIDQMAFFVMGNKAFPLAPVRQKVLQSLQYAMGGMVRCEEESSANESSIGACPRSVNVRQ